MGIIKKGAVYAVLAILGVTVFANAVILSYDRFVAKDGDSLKSRPIALVFGGGMLPNGQMAPMLTDRVIRAVELYKSGKVQKLMMTGDDGGFRNDEVSAMRQYAIQAGVPAGDVLVDPHGYRTYESCFRESRLYGVTSTIAVSQKFHLTRIAYLCRRMGIETVGVAADMRDYGSDNLKMQIREVFARVKAVWQLEISKPKPLSLEK